MTHIGLRGSRQLVVCLAWVIATSVSAVTKAQEETPPRLPDEVASKLDNLIEEVREAEAELKLQFRRSRLIRTKMDIQRVAVADPTIVEVVTFGPREVQLIGKEAGSTTVTLWLTGDGQSNILSMLVTVQRDTGVDERRVLEYGELERMLNSLFPNSQVQLFPIADKLIVKGQARDAEEAAQIMAIIRQRGSAAGVSTNNGVITASGVTSQGAAAEPFPEGSQLPEANVVSLLRVPGEQQVMLKVRIAELKRSSLRRLGINFDFQAGDFFMQSAFAKLPNVLFNGTFDEDSFNVLLDALDQNGVAKILAEPNLVVLSGRTATFLAGGEFPVPTVVGVEGVGAATTEFRGFGTRVTFTPTIIDKDMIRLQVNPEFSALNRENSVNGIFGLDTRSASTVVDLREGQVLAIAGLIQQQQRGTLSRFPGVGDVPGLGLLVSGKETTLEETELLVVVSPELVHAMEPEDVPLIMPGMDVNEPNDVDFYLRSRIEGRPNCDHRSTVWPNYRDPYVKPKLYRDCLKAENYYIHGSHGFSY